MRNVSSAKQHTATILERLAARYPAPRSQLEADSPWEILVSTVLAAQCTDARVNMVTPELFRRWPGPAELALARRTVALAPTVLRVETAAVAAVALMAVHRVAREAPGASPS